MRCRMQCITLAFAMGSSWSMPADQPKNTDSHLLNIHNSISELKGYTITMSQRLYQLEEERTNVQKALRAIQLTLSHVFSQGAATEVSTQNASYLLHQINSQLQELSKNQTRMEELISNNAEVTSAIHTGVSDGMLNEKIIMYGTTTIVAILVLVFIFFLFSSYLTATRNPNSRLIVRVTQTVLSHFTNMRFFPYSPSNTSVLVSTNPQETASTSNTTVDLPPSYSAVNLSTV